MNFRYNIYNMFYFADVMYFVEVQDGRARRYYQKKGNSGGKKLAKLLPGNYDREFYQPSLKKQKRYKRKCFFGNGLKSRRDYKRPCVGLVESGSSGNLPEAD